MPMAWATKLALITKRVEKTRDEYVKNDRAKNFQNMTLKIINELMLSIEKAYRPAPPKTIVSSQKYALSRKFSGTYVALLDKDGNLVKTVIIAKEVLSELPEYVIQDREIQVTMTARVLRIPQLTMQKKGETVEFEKNIPKRTEKIVPFACDRDTQKIIEYTK